jgi:hypothetical protein
MRVAFLERSAAIFNEAFFLKHLRSSFPQEPNAKAEKLRLASGASRAVGLSQADCWASNLLP